MRAYDCPRVLSTHAVDELVREAATCMTSYEPVTTTTVSDRDLKERVEGIEDALEGIGSIRTR